MGSKCVRGGNGVEIGVVKFADIVGRGRVEDEAVNVVLQDL